MTKSKQPRTRTRTVADHLANVVGGMSDIMGTCTELRSSKEWNDDWLAPKLTSGIGGLIG